MLRYDKRGVGQSGGRVEAATMADYAEDARAAVRMLSARKDIDRRRIANDYDVAIKNMEVQREQIQAQKDAADTAGRAELASARQELEQLRAEVTP